MKRLLYPLMLGLAGVISLEAYAGNDTKRGSGGASELLINPWAKSSGWAGSNTAGARGVESFNLNIGGLAHVKGVELVGATTRYLSGSDITINNLGLGIAVSDYGVIGVQVMAMNLGDFLETTYLLPDGTGNTYRPNMLNIAAGYSQKFSNSISGGVAARLVNHSIPNVDGTGVTIDVGVQYQGGKDDRFKLGVSLRNLGPRMGYSGNGLSTRGNISGRVASFAEQIVPPASQIEMPAMLNIGASYDFNLGQESKLTAAATFQSNSFTQDQYLVGLQYSFREYFSLRGGYNIQNNLFSTDQRTDVNLGPSFGASIALPLDKVIKPAEGEEAKKQPVIGFDYSYRATAPFNGTHSIGLTLNF